MLDEAFRRDWRGEEFKYTPRSIHKIAVVGGGAAIPKIQQIITQYFHGGTLYFPTTSDRCYETVYGCIMNGAILGGSRSSWTTNALLIDLYPHSLGVDPGNGSYHAIVREGIIIPCLKSFDSTTHSDNQTGLLLQIYEGERNASKASDNTLLGSLHVTGIPPMPKGKAELEITFDMDANSDFKVRSLIKATSAKQEVSFAADQMSDAEAKEVEDMIIVKESI